MRGHLLHRVDGRLLGIGVGTELVAVAALLILFRRRGWMGKGS